VFDVETQRVKAFVLRFRSEFAGDVHDEKSFSSISLHFLGFPVDRGDFDVVNRAHPRKSSQMGLWIPVTAHLARKTAPCNAPRKAGDCSRDEIRCGGGSGIVRRMDRAALGSRWDERDAAGS